MCNFLFFQPPFFFRILFGPELNVGRYSGGPRFDGGIRAGVGAASRAARAARLAL